MRFWKSVSRCWLPQALEACFIMVSDTTFKEAFSLRLAACYKTV